MTRIDITLAGTAGLDLIVNCKIADWVRLLTPRFVLSDRAHVSNTKSPQSLIVPAPILMFAAPRGVERFGEALHSGMSAHLGDALG